MQGEAKKGGGYRVEERGGHWFIVDPTTRTAERCVSREDAENVAAALNRAKPDGPLPEPALAGELLKVVTLLRDAAKAEAEKRRAEVVNELTQGYAARGVFRFKAGNLIKAEGAWGVWERAVRVLTEAAGDRFLAAAEYFEEQYLDHLKRVADRQDCDRYGCDGDTEASDAAGQTRAWSDLARELKSFQRRVAKGGFADDRPAA
jgi:hypothetical protein